MAKVKALIEKKYKIVVCLFFVAYLFIGISIFKHYGISWDEHISRMNGVITVKYVVERDQTLFTYRDRYYGTVFETLLVAIERVLDLTKSPRAVFFMRHLVTFLLFYTGVFFFYLLSKYRFGSWKIGLLGSLFLIMSPRIFAHSFYNSKDIPCLVMFIISIYTLIRYLDKMTMPRAAIHALACALLIDIRIVGIIVPFFTILFLIADLLIIRIKRIEFETIIASFLTYMFLLIFFTVLFWPILWTKPVYHFAKAFMEMRRFPWSGTVLYLGRGVKAANLPWHYIPVWIIISTPLFYSFCFFVGCFVSMKLLLRNSIQSYLSKKNDFIFMLWFFLPLVAVIVFGSVLYDAWRQMFFVYPAFLMLSLVGLTFLFESIKTKFQGLYYKIINAIVIFLVAGNLINTAQFMTRYHPYQNVYFNRLAGRDMKEIKNNFELDYWGLSYRKALEYILRNDPDKVIKVNLASFPGTIIANILTSDDRNRLVYVKNPDEAKYFLSNYRGHKGEYSYKNEYYSIKIRGTKIMVVYKMN
ncbi:hypothetical protein MUO65_02590 [bacterium]|nr:hypothetical protein [bacterium]